MRAQASRRAVPSPASAPLAGRRRWDVPLLLALVPIAVWLGTAHLRAEYVLRHASLADLQALSTRQPHDPHVLYHLGLRAQEAGQGRLAVDSLLRAARIAPDDEAIWRAWARADSQLLGPMATDRLGQPPAAIILRLFLKTHPNSAGAHADLARLYLEGGHLQSAYAEAAAAVRDDPGDGPAWQVMGEATLRQRNYGLAAAAYRQAVRCDPRDWRSACGLGQALQKQGRPAEASAEFQEAARVAPGEALPPLELGEALVYSAPAQADMARRYLLQANAGAASLSPEQRYDLCLALGQSFEQQARWREALPWLQRAEALGPFEPQTHYALAKAYQRLGDSAASAHEYVRQQQLVAVEQQITVFTDRANATPADTSIRLRLARLEAQRGELGPAKQSCWAILVQDPGNKAARAFLAALVHRESPVQ